MSLDPAALAVDGGRAEYKAHFIIRRPILYCATELLMLLKNYRAGRLIASPKRHPAIRHLAAVKGRRASLTGVQANAILAAMNIDASVSYFGVWIDY